MTTVGYGDIGPVTDLEILFALWCQYIGCVVFGYIVGLMGAEVTGLDVHEGPIEQKIDFLEAIMDKHRVQKEVRHRVRRQYRTMKDTASLFLVDVVLDDLPAHLRKDLTLSIFRNQARTFELLAGRPHTYIAEMVTLLKPYAAVKADVLYRAGSSCDEIFIVDEGEILLYHEEIQFEALGNSMAFGDEGLAGHLQYVFSASAGVSSHLFFIHRPLARQLLERHPTVGVEIRAMVLHKLERWHSITTTACKGSGSEDNTIAGDDNATTPVATTGAGRDCSSRGGGSAADYATKADLQRLESKIDQLLELQRETAAASRS